ncbi:DUF305 domain-containing protein [Stutzerimonas azotifigens]|uniref:DUF305 domain-containing protein n=1 Tax=Stutzerimonas azotifigens TaxID=291995 RepID=UPI0004131E90|nr:DUF305 domain-containing protein [Stutzerimonas azotifigens]
MDDLPILPTARIALALGALAWASMASAQDDQPAAPTEAPGFTAENNAAMARMMVAMHMEPSGDVDRDFVEMMVPHHQGAIDMAKAMLRYGRSEPLKRLAQEIIITQQQEIAAMRLAIGDPLPAAPTSAAPTDSQPAHTHR